MTSTGTSTGTNTGTNAGPNTADPKALAKARRRQARDAETLDAALRWFFDDKKGRRIAWWLLEETHVFRTSMTGNSQTFFLEGERNIGLKLMDRLMTLSPGAFALMQAEARAEAEGEGGEAG